MGDYVRVNFNLPSLLHEKFQALFPYRGEKTAFFIRCVEAAVLSDEWKGKSLFKEMDKIIEESRRNPKR